MCGEKLEIAGGTMPEVTDETVAKGRGGERLGELEVVSVKKLFAGLMDILNLVAEVIGGDAILQELAEAFVAGSRERANRASRRAYGLEEGYA